ncbi:MAG TPA: CoA transferase, partial [Dehalococcoidia bacterium]|nr:CoA transferase [Dehalococcoidia bacterium]
MQTDTTARPLPLVGVRVVDFSWIVAGPQATRILADLGAEVIRVENEGHVDSMRLGNQANPQQPSYNGSGFFSNFNRNKRSVTANLHHPQGHEFVERLIAISDVVIENYSAGVFDRLG